MPSRWNELHAILECAEAMPDHLARHYVKSAILALALEIRVGQMKRSGTTKPKPVRAKPSSAATSKRRMLSRRT